MTEFLTSGPGFGGTVQGGANLLIGASDQALKWTQFAIEGRKSDAGASFPPVDATPKLEVVNANLERLFKARLEAWTANKDDDEDAPRPQQLVATGFTVVGRDRLVLGCQPSRSKRNKLQLTIDWDYVTINLVNAETDDKRSYGKFIQGLRLSTAYTHTPSKGVKFQIKGDESRVTWAEDHCVVHLKLSMAATNARSTAPWLRDFVYTIVPNVGDTGGTIRSDFGGGEQVEVRTPDDESGRYKRFTDEGTMAMVHNGNVGVLSGARPGVKYKIRCYLDRADDWDTATRYPVVIGDHANHLWAYYEDAVANKVGRLLVATLEYHDGSARHPYGKWSIDLNGAEQPQADRIREEVLAVKKTMGSSKHVEFE